MSSIQNVLNNLQSDGVQCQLNELVRYRPVAKKLSLAPASAIRSSMAGAMVSRFKGRGMEFDEARHYQAGDDIRSIDWRVTARTGKTHTKLYREERERPVLIYIDFTPSMHFGSELLYKSVQALHAAALIVFSAIARGDKVGCMLLSEYEEIEIKPRSSIKHALTMLNQMVRLQQNSVSKHINQNTNASQKTSNKVDEGLSHLSMIAKPGSLVYLMSDFAHYTDKHFIEMGRVSRHCELRPLRIFDPLEESLPKLSVPQDVLISDGISEQNIVIGDKGFARDYSEQHAHWFDSLKKRSKKAGLNLRQVSAAIPIEEQLLSAKHGLILGSEA